jgi:aminopeptidase N
MQEDKSTSQEGDPSRRLWFALIGSIAMAAFLCLAIVVISLTSTESPALPVAAKELITEAIPELGQPEEVAAPTAVSSEIPLVAQPGGRSASDPYIPELGNSGYDVQHYTLQLVLDPATEYLEGTTTIEALSTINGLSEISLDFIGYEIGVVTVDGLAVAFERQENKLVIKLPQNLPQGDSFSVVVAYRGTPPSEPSVYLRSIDHLGLHYSGENNLFAISEPDGARYWFPSNDHLQDKANFRFELVVPKGLVAVANGQLKETQAGVLPNGEIGELFIWEHNYPMAPYLAVIAAGDYERIEDRSPEGIPLRHYVQPENREAALEAASEIGQAIDWMAELFGPYPFETFGFVTAPVTGRSMETQTMVLLSHDLIGKRTAVHELAHMWFGDWVGLDSWSEMWRKEGFATYVQLMWEYRDDPDGLDVQMATMRSVVEGNDKQYPINNPPPEYLFELNVYFEGALAVHALRREIGDQAFFEGVREYISRYGGKTASDADFQSVMSEAAGRPLDAFFSSQFPSQ